MGPCAPAEPSARLDNGHLVPQLGEFVCRAKTGHSGAEDRDSLSRTTYVAGCDRAQLLRDRALDRHRGFPICSRSERFMKMSDQLRIWQSAPFIPREQGGKM